MLRACLVHTSCRHPKSDDWECCLSQPALQGTKQKAINKARLWPMGQIRSTETNM
jgi:hypothetical protein